MRSAWDCGLIVLGTLGGFQLGRILIGAVVLCCRACGWRVD